jgi:glycosyltransferase involved in cell wall biosynthesis
VISEANAFGVPCLASKVGGIPSLVLDNVNGMCVTPYDAIETYCDFADSLMREPKRYREMALAAYGEFRNRLNWRSSGQRVRELLKEYC